MTALRHELVTDLYEELVTLAAQMRRVEARIRRIFTATELCQRLAQVEGVGPLIATAMVAAVGDPTAFKNGRQLAAWLGLVPRQQSSGHRQVLLGISKRGDRYLRMLLIHGGHRRRMRRREDGSPQSLGCRAATATRDQSRMCGPGQ